VGYNTVKILDDDLTYETITENIDLTEALKFSTEEESKDFIDYVSLSEKERRVSDVKEKLNEKGKEAEHLYKELQRLREGNEEDKNSNNSPDQNIFNFPW
jgi:predicted RNase H-like nuclease (RuvC/YqgF family)